MPKGKGYGKVNGVKISSQTVYPSGVAKKRGGGKKKKG